MIGFGTWPLGGVAYGPVPQADAFAAVEFALGSGIRLFDTANIYGSGRAESLLGIVLEGVDDVEIVTKCGYVDERSGKHDFSFESLHRSTESSLDRLRRDTVSTLLLHSPPADVLAAGEATAALEHLQTIGVTNRIGVSVRSVDDWDIALEWKGCQVVELILNLVDQRPIDLGILLDAERRGIDVIARVPLCFGLLSGRHAVGAQFADGDQRNRWQRQQISRWIDAAESFRFLERGDRTLTQSALAFAESRGGVRAAIPGMKTVAQVKENAAALDVPLELDEVERVRATWARMTGLIPGN